ncbi:MAG: imelysin family protein [Chloroflexota bacterium]
MFFSYLSRIFVFSLLALFISIVPTQAQTSFDRVAMIEGIVTETVLPLHRTFAEEALALEAVAIIFEADPTEENLVALRQMYINTVIAFERTSPFHFQRLMPYVTQIERHPPNIEFVETYIASVEPDPIDLELAARFGSAQKGLPVLDYLLFADDALTRLTDSATRRQYVSILTTDIRQIADTLVDEWTLGADGYGDQFIAADDDPSSVRSAVSILSNEIIVVVEFVPRIWLGIPLGHRHGGEPQPELVEAPYSHTSVMRLIANLEAVQMTINGTGDSPSFADYLDFLGAEHNGEPMSQAINAQIDATIADLSTIEEPLAIAVVDDTDGVTAVFDTSLALLRLVKTDMAHELGITVTFNSNDGD